MTNNYSYDNNHLIIRNDDAGYFMDNILTYLCISVVLTTLASLLISASGLIVIVFINDINTTPWLKVLLLFLAFLCFIGVSLFPIAITKITLKLFRSKNKLKDSEKLAETILLNSVKNFNLLLSFFLHLPIGILIYFVITFPLSDIGFNLVLVAIFFIVYFISFFAISLCTNGYIHHITKDTKNKNIKIEMASNLDDKTHRIHW